jgi:sugar/nucleoside kinase (ribokinase family)
MSARKIVISGTGCALADNLYNGVSFDSPSFRKYLSVKTGDGGLSPGRLVFSDELERFSGKSYPEILKEITGCRKPDAFNAGGPSLVSMIHASQMLDQDHFKVNFFGIAGRDETADKIFSILRSIPLGTENYVTTGKRATPFTDVFSDADYDNGHGERTFVNNIGAALNFTPQYLGDRFFESDIVCFGGTALVPYIHDNLTDLLSEAKKRNCITVVNTVYDFRNEKKNPGGNWPLVKNHGDFGSIDILIMDREEALRISGKQTIEEAAGFFAGVRAPAFIITNGAGDLYAMSSGELFKRTDLIKLPVSQKAKNDMQSAHGMKGDTTGCGDNFAGGIIASAAWQLKKWQKGDFKLKEAISWGIASGGFTCFITGGTYKEKYRGEKLERVTGLHKEYLKQIGE